MDSKQTLVETFGTEIGGKLYGAAVRLGAQYNIPVDDIAQDIAEAALQVQAEYGYVNVNITCKHAINAFMNSYRYGPTQYYIMRGYGEIQETDRECGNFSEYTNAANENFDGYNADRPDNWFDTIQSTEVQYDLLAEFSAILDSLDADTRTVALGLMAGYSQKEIAQAMGKSNAWVVNVAKKRLAAAFAAYAA